MANSHDSSSPSWTSRLPLSVWNVFGSMMDREGLGNMRLVSKEWQKVVEESIGVKVKVDDSIDGNLDFVKRVKAGRARIVNWTEEIGAEPATHLFQHPDWLKKLKLCGKMPAQWKIRNLCQFSSLAHLVLRDKVLYYNNLTGHQYPLSNFDPTSPLSMEKLMIKAFESEDPPLEHQPIELKSLRTLEIVSFLVRGAPRTHNYLVMVVNVCYILNNVMSPLLSVVQLSTFLDEEVRSSLNKLKWTLLPLHRFLDNHRASLRQLLLPTFLRSTDLFQREDLSKSFPTNLQKLMLKFVDESRVDVVQRESGVVSTFDYLDKCLQGQTQLKDVYFNFYNFPLKWTTDALTALANSCGRTLKYLHLDGCSDRSGGSLDLQVLSVCYSLEVLEMGSCGRTKNNVDKLPASLKVLAISKDGGSGDVEIEEPNIFKRLTGLEWLSLEGIRLPTALGNIGNQGLQRQFCRTMIKDLVGLRRLQGFNVGVRGVALNKDVSIVKMLSPLDPSINPAQRHQQSTVSFNLNWHLLGRPPWSEKPFDRFKWDLEKLIDDAEEPRREVVLPQPEAGENANDVGEEDEQDDDDDMDLDDEDVSSDEDDF